MSCCARPLSRGWRPNGQMGSTQDQRRASSFSLGVLSQPALGNRKAVEVGEAGDCLILGQEDPLEEKVETHSNILAGINLATVDQIVAYYL